MNIKYWTENLKTPDLNNDKKYLASSTERISLGDANKSSISQEIPYILCNPKVCYRVYNSPVPVSGSVKEKSGTMNKILERRQLVKLIAYY
jgi:hypothetical protein